MASAFLEMSLGSKAPSTALSTRVVLQLVR